MSRPPIPGLADVRLAEAAAWRVHLTEIDADTTAEFEAWLANPANTQAWAYVSHPWDYLSRQAHEPELVAARQAALGDAKHASRRHIAPILRRRVVGAIAAVLIAGVTVWGGVQWLQRPDDYRTAPGERRIISLVDGSKISLDASSDVTVRYTKNSRELHLLRGQARFDVAHDVERPFSVLAGNQKVIATGTAFNIDMAGPKILVTLIEGHVVVLDENIRSAAIAINRPKWPSSVELKAGQQLAAVDTAPPAVEPVDIQRVTAWTNGQVIFDNESLSSVVARVNRYARTQIVISDPKVGAMRISGVLNAGDVSGFVDIVTHYLPVRAATNNAGDIALVSEAKN
jgi:transmembrane sensor